MTAVYGLIGKKLGHSFSKKYFTQKFAESGLDARYELYELPDIEAFPGLLAQEPHLRGLNVTIPYKSAVIPYLDRLSPAAAAIGAVNTIKPVDGQYWGYNSDIHGFRTTLEAFLGGVRPRQAIVLGTGGAAKAVGYVLEQYMQLSTVCWVSRHPQSADQISYEALQDLDLQAYPLIINTTPVGMYPDVAQMPPFPVDHLGPDHFVYDLIYNPETTRLLAEAARKGAQTLNGMPMLIGQAEKSWEYWNAPPDQDLS